MSEGPPRKKRKASNILPAGSSLNDDKKKQNSSTGSSEWHHKQKKKHAEFRKNLPVYTHRKEILELIADNDVVLVVAETVRRSSENNIIFSLFHAIC
jgi:HrpA-like RNA helicase